MKKREGEVWICLKLKTFSTKAPCDMPADAKPTRRELSHKLGAGYRGCATALDMD